MSPPSTSPGPGQRLYYLDWLRVLAMIGIFLFHNARFYDIFGDWHVRNATTDLGASIFVAFMSQWMMPLFFLIAGGGAYCALKVRRPGQYLGERCLRLFVPLVFGMFVIVVPQAYFEAVSHGTPLEGYNLFQVYVLYLGTLPELKFFHLWFLAYLFVFSLLTVPLFADWAGSGRSVVSRLAGVFRRPWLLLLLLAASLAVLDIFLFPAGFWGSRGNGNFSIVAYLLFFVSGYLLFANGRILEWAGRRWWAWLAAAVLALGLLGLFLNVLMDRAAGFGTGPYAAAMVIEAASTWCWLMAILGLGKRFLDRPGRFVTYANEAVLPFYVLHQTVIISIGFYVVQWDAAVWLKYLTIGTSSFVVIMLIYEFLVRHWNVLRFLFGMRWRRKAKAAPAEAGET